MSESKPKRSYHRFQKLSILPLILLFFISLVAAANLPLEPADTSSPRATMESFLGITDEISLRYNAYRSDPSRESQEALSQSMASGWRLLDLSDIPPVGQFEVANESFLLLWEVIARTKLPDIDEIPDATAFETPEGSPVQAARWNLDGTEISILRVEEGPRTGQFLFSPDTVNRVKEFYRQVQSLPYQQMTPVKNLYRTAQLGTGWMIPLAWVEALPEFANTLILGQVLWKWIVLLVIFSLFGMVLRLIYRWSRRKKLNVSLRSYLRYLSTPLAIIVLVPPLRYFIRAQLNVSGGGADWPDYLLEIVFGVGVVWLVWLSASRWVEVVIASPKILSESLDAHLLRLLGRAIGILAALVLVFQIANEIGIPMYGLVAGAGVGGIAIALAAQSTLENFIGSLNLFVDRPVRIGDLCRYDDESNPGWRPVGVVEAIGLRSTRIRRFDRSLITIPNADFAQSHIVNLSKTDRFLFSTVLGLRYETTDDQLRFLLTKLRELFHAHPKTLHTLEEPIRIRFSGLGESSLNVDVRAYIKTSSFNEFSAVREDLLLRMLRIVDNAGTCFAFPSSTVYHTRDPGMDIERQQAAEKQVREWAAAQELPFPDINEKVRRTIADSLDYPPAGSPDADRA